MSGSRLRLYGATSGFVELEAPAVASDGTLTLPSTFGGIGSNVVQAVKTDTQTISGTTFVDIMSVTITPSIATAKILVRAVVPVGTGASQGPTLDLTDASNVSLIVPDSPGSRTAGFAQHYANTPGYLVPWCVEFLDFPATTDPVTYKVRGRSSDTGVNFHINRTDTDTDNAQFTRTISTMTAIEVAG